MNKIERIISHPFGVLGNGEKCQLFTLSNIHGCKVSITNYGGIITNLSTKDAKGNLANIVLGYDNIQAYQDDPFYLGAIIGPYANRIENGEFQLNKQTVQLTLNDKDNHLHGANSGLHNKVWQYKINKHEHSASLQLTTKISEGDAGYPSHVDFEVLYTFDDDNALSIEYRATSSKPTVINLTQHSYFNLSGDNKFTQKKMVDHQLVINAEQFLPINNQGIPTGIINKVNHTPFDFRQLKSIARDIDADDEQIKQGHGYDHYWLLANKINTKNKISAQVIEPISGRRLTLYTDQPGLQFYTANFLEQDKTNQEFEKRSGFCLETQHAPNQPNLAKSLNLASTLLTPEQPFYSKTVFKFDCIPIPLQDADFSKSRKG